MKNVFSFLLIAAVFAPVFAVPDNAIDFTVTDVNGTKHTLFTYLDAGKYVLLEFTTNSAS